MLEKNKKKEERRHRAQNFIGCRPARFKSKKEYNRAKEKAKAREEQREPLDKTSRGFLLRAWRSPQQGDLDIFLTS